MFAQDPIAIILDEDGDADQLLAQQSGKRHILQPGMLGHNHDTVVPIKHARRRRAHARQSDTRDPRPLSASWTVSRYVP